MITTFAAGQDEIARRVKQFQTNFTAYHAPDYKEAHAVNNRLLGVDAGWLEVYTTRVHTLFGSVRGDDRVDHAGRV